MKYLITLAALMCCLTARAEEQFLDPGELAELKPVAGVADTYNYNPPGAPDGSSYPKVLIGSVTFFFADDSKHKDADPDELKKIGDSLKDSLRESIGKHATVVEQPGEGVLQINVGVARIKLKNKKRGLLGYTPIGLVTTTAGNLAGLRTRLGSAVIQGEVIDSKSGEKIGIFAVRKIKHDDDKKDLTWKDVRDALQEATDRLAAAKYPG